MYNDNLFDTKQLLTLLSSVLITLSLSLDCIVSTQQLNVVSSAYIITWKSLLTFGKSLIYIINKGGGGQDRSLWNAVLYVKHF